MMQIRDATPDDQADIRHLTWLLWDHHHEQRPARFRTAEEVISAAEPSSPPFQLAERIWVAEAAGQVSDYLRAVLRDAPQNLAYQPQRVVIILELAVLPEFRQQGSGRAFLAMVRNWAHASAAEAIEVQVFGFNERAISLYAAMGFALWLLRACLRSSAGRPHLSRVQTRIPPGGAEWRADVDGPTSDAS